MSAEILASSEENIARCAEVLRSGQLVAFPTETVFGLGALVTDTTAVRRVFETKGRPTNHPLIAHAHARFDWSDGWVRFASPVQAEWFRLLTEAFWPGPLTLIVPRGAKMPLAVTGGQESVGVRCPSHSVAQALLKEVAVPVAAPSANRFGKVSPTRASHVVSELGGRISWVLDGEVPEVGIESTIVSLLDGVRVLRPGMITTEHIQAILGIPVFEGLPKNIGKSEKSKGFGKKPEPIRYSGGLEKHYSPDARVCVLAASQIEKEFLPKGKVLFIGWSSNFLQAAQGCMARRSQEGDVVQPCSNDPVKLARSLYLLLRQADEQGFAGLVFESPPPRRAEWVGLIDRLSRAAY